MRAAAKLAAADILLLVDKSFWVEEEPLFNVEFFRVEIIKRPSVTTSWQGFKIKYSDWDRCIVLSLRIDLSAFPYGTQSVVPHRTRHGPNKKPTTTSEETMRPWALLCWSSFKKRWLGEHFVWDFPMCRLGPRVSVWIVGIPVPS